MPTIALVPTAEAAFIAGLTDRQMNRVVDERLVPETLFRLQGSHRSFTKLGAAFARFYFATEDLLLAGARKQVIEELSSRIDRLPLKDKLLALAGLEQVNWKVERKYIAVDVLPFIQEAQRRAQEVEQADALVSTDPDTMAGEPVFTGTRVPISIVLGSLAQGVGAERLSASYPFLTEAHMQAAKVYDTVHPRRGRPRRLADADPQLQPRVTRVVKRTTSA